ncbi:MAG: hypothetical protein KDE56_06735 [Anaerolineales bacterium]|nr:hypothetical protein [Anaerolineales bacterium]
MPVYKSLVRLVFMLCVCGGICLVLFSSASAMTPDVQQLMVSFPFSDGFESGSFGSGWTPGSAANGVAQIRTDDPHSGTYHAFLGQHQGGQAYVTLDLLINLANQSDVYLDFWWRTTGDVSWVGNAEDSGIYLSDDNGNSWHKIMDFQDNFHYSHDVINLANAAAIKGLSLNDHFRIRFYFERYSGSRSGGIRLDDIRLTQSSQTVASFPVQDNFETQIFQQGLYLRSLGQGVAKISNDAPHSGSYHVSLEQQVEGNAQAALVWLVDLSNKSDVYLDFWWRTTGDVSWVGNAERSGVYLSDDNGASWKKIKDFSDNLHYSHEIINLANAAANQGLSLNKYFRVKFHFERYGGSRIGGIRLDDIRLTTSSQVKATFPFQNGFESATFVKGLYPKSLGQGIGEISSETPHSGTKHVFLGQRASGYALAALFVLIDLPNETDVYLDFWWRTAGDLSWSGNAERSGIYISDDNGSSWKKIKDFSDNLQYKHETINLTDAAVNQGLRLNDHFLISFHYERYGGSRLGSLRIDDIRLWNGSSTNRVYLPFIEK